MKLTRGSALGVLGSLAVLIVLAAYLNFALGWVSLSQRLTLALGFAIGPVAIVGVLGISDRLAKVFRAGPVRTGAVFLIIGFALLTLMLTMQQAIFAEYRQLRGGAPVSGASETLEHAFALANQVQLGADVAFDIFYSLGMVVTSIALLGGTRLPRLVGAYGLLAGGGLLVLNIGTFPVPPSAAGAVDLGPATIVWWLGVIYLARRVGRGDPATRGASGTLVRNNRAH